LFRLEKWISIFEKRCKGNVTWWNVQIF